MGRQKAANGRRRFASLPVVEGLESRTLLSVSVIKDINQQDLDPRRITDVAGTAYFVTAGPSDGSELWKSNGTTAGTTKLGDFPAPPASGTDTSPKNLTDYEGSLFFSAGSPTVSGDEIEAVDPTTGAIRDVTFLQGAMGTQPAQFTVANGLLFFTDTAADGGLNLLRTDGTASGTVLLKSDLKGTESFAEELAGAGGLLYFLASDATHGRELWESDGTAAGTKIVADLAAGLSDSDPQYLTPVGSSLFFNDDEGGSPALWKTDGTSAGTVEIDANEAIDYGDRAVVGTTLDFSGVSSNISNGVWASDGTAAGTRLVYDPVNASPIDLTAAQGRFYFSMETYVESSEGYPSESQIWTSDGTTAGTTLLTTVDYAQLAPTTSDSATLLAVGSKLFFTAYDPAHGLELWSSDGTKAGTGLLDDLDPGADGSDPRNFASVGGKLFFAAHDGTNANELWSSDGTTAGTSLVSTFASIATPSSFNTPSAGDPDNSQYSVTFGGTTYFDAIDGDHGEELWKTDGTTAGTVLVKDIAPGPDGSSIFPMTAYDGKIYFLASSSDSNQFELWSSDGTTAGTVEVMGEPTGYAYDVPFTLTLFRDRLYFLADGSSGQALFSTDGTAEGTSVVATFPGFGRTYDGDDLVASADDLYFDVADQTQDGGLWSSDGTTAGTHQILAASGQSLTPFGNDLIFDYNDGTHGNEPWISDGTAAGTHLLADLAPGSASSSPTDFTVLGSKVNFAAGNGALDIWSSDGTAAGTMAISDSVGIVYNLGSMLSIGSTLLFTNGFGDPTALFAFSNGAVSTIFSSKTENILGLYEVGGRAYFTTSSSLGDSVYETDATAPGTVDLGLIGPSSTKTPPYPVQTNADGNLVVFGDDGVHGGEPLLVTDPPILDAVSDLTAAPGTAIRFTASATKPGASIQYRLAAGAPSGAAIDPSSGVFTWTAPAVSASTTYAITLVATDLANPSLVASQTFHVIDQPVNHAPVLNPISNATVVQGSPLSFQATATDPDAGQTLAFSLDAGAPSGAAINATSGAFSWTPSSTLAPGVYPVTVRVTDDGTPALSASQQVDITVTVANNPDAQPGTFGFSTTSYSVDERKGNATITIDRTGGSVGSVSISYATQDLGAPASGVSYTPVSGTLTFAEGETSKTFTIPILNPGYTSGSTEFAIHLSNPTGGATILPNGSTANVIITVDDPTTQPPPILPAPITVPTISTTIGRGKLTAIVVHFSGEVGGAGNLGNYHLVQVVKHGRKTTYKTIALKAAAYDATHFQTTLTLAKKLPSTTPLQLAIVASGITDHLGRPIDGNHDGQAGGNLIASVSRGRVAIDSVRTRRRSEPLHGAPRL